MTNATRPPPPSGPFRLPRLDSPGYQAVFRQERKVFGQTLSVWVAVFPDVDHKVGVVVSKRTFRRAVDRNRAKRLLRETFRLSRHLLRRGISVVLVARMGIAGKTRDDVMRDFERTCKRARIWR